MVNLLLLLLGAAFVVSSAFVLIYKQGRRGVFLNRLHFRHRRASGSNTPPRSLSPGKKNLDIITGPNYADTFPPSRRFTLAEIQSNLPAILGKPREKKPCLPLTTSYLEAKTPMYTPCEFSTEEIKALGDFPDYATLSGVPLPRPYHEFDIKKAKPRPYRPFRWNYHQTMCEWTCESTEAYRLLILNAAISKMETDWWLELESSYEKRIKQRQDLFAQHGNGVLDALPGSELCCKELMEMALQFLCARYPQYFRLDKEKMIFYNGILHTESDLRATHPLHVLLNNVPEDFAITLRDPTSGAYHFRAGVICSALGWNVTSKIGLHLQQIHAPIPDYKEKMQFSMDRCVA